MVAYNTHNEKYYTFLTFHALNIQQVDMGRQQLVVAKLHNISQSYTSFFIFTHINIISNESFVKTGWRKRHFLYVVVLN